ncbi:ubiquinone/menaquinone biosynthesis methyltransferase [Caldinitratiruptor microaerophilus]|uniref:Demethylmenaquinone methyltransferase n=1 Tax=Caldinitratiruptor microaerophilus TaxID=671077 RepID=A0AA35CHR2_9FIRM|nr:ubiquinone/menaquinone biosynthesis methyltransferase [Caldinitratiruptor microaerophilus]BDG59219.1 demethylmenaquinone methyltransferase [Caldinitratiruptor microaerophilus]
MYRHPTPEEKEAYVRALFDRIASHYDRMNQIMSLGQWGRWHRIFARMAGYRPGMRVLDVACGTGDLTLLAASRVGAEGRVVGVDISPGMLARARERVQASPWAGVIELCEGNALDLPFPDGTFDIVTMGWAMRNVRDIPRTVAEALRVLRPGGRYLNLDAAEPQGPIGRLLLRAWWGTLLPVIDRLVVGVRDPDEPVRPYTYLSRSLEGYPSPARLEEIFRQAGFVETGHVPLMMGSVCIHYGTRP